MTKTVIEMDREDLVGAIREVQEDLILSKFISRFNNRKVDSDTACAILDISYPTLQRYVKEGRITAIQSSKKGRYSFSLPYLLTVDIRKGTHFKPTGL